jgi:hypothetical protein
MFGSSAYFSFSFLSPAQMHSNGAKVVFVIIFRTNQGKAAASARSAAPYFALA